MQEENTTTDQNIQQEAEPINLWKVEQSDKVDFIELSGNGIGYIKAAKDFKIRGQSFEKRSKLDFELACQFDWKILGESG